MKIRLITINAALSNVHFRTPTVKFQEDITTPVLKFGDIFTPYCPKELIDTMVRDIIKNPQTIPEHIKKIFPQMVKNWKNRK